MYALHQKEAAFFTASRCMQITQLADAWIRRAGDNCHRGWIASNTKCVGARFIAPVWGGGASPPTHRLWNCLQCSFDQCAEGILIMYSHLSENLAVYTDIGSMNSVHQLTVAHAVHTCRSINARNPEAAHIPFAITAVTVHIGH